jgi:hypothetical protein
MPMEGKNKGENDGKKKWPKMEMFFCKIYCMFGGGGCFSPMCSNSKSQMTLNLWPIKIFCLREEEHSASSPKAYAHICYGGMKPETTHPVIILRIPFYFLLNGFERTGKIE